MRSFTRMRRWRFPAALGEVFTLVGLGLLGLAALDVAAYVRFVRSLVFR